MPSSRPPRTTPPTQGPTTPETVPGPSLIGLTGGIAAGKSEALRILAELGAEVVSTDGLVHELLGTSEVRGSKDGALVDPGVRINLDDHVVGPASRSVRSSGL